MVAEHAVGLPKLDRCVLLALIAETRIGESATHVAMLALLHASTLYVTSGAALGMEVTMRACFDRINAQRMGELAMVSAKAAGLPL